MDGTGRKEGASRGPADVVPPTIDARVAAAHDLGGPLPRPFGRFVLKGLIGRGGMGAVYEAHDSRLLRTVALKMIPGAVGDTTLAERVLREARIAGVLDHPGVVPVYDYGVIDDIPYLTMPLVRGATLASLMPYMNGTATTPAPGWLALPRERGARIALLLEWFDVALAGLHAAHEHGVVHRDIKPPNLLYDTEARALRLADFGIARADHLASSTRQGTLLGTVAYMSPEQVRGEIEGIDARSDVYSMGVTIYHALTGRLPHDADSAAAYMKQVLENAPALAGRKAPSLPSDLRTILAKAMENKPRDRYSTVAALRDDLARFRRCEPIEARRVGFAGRTQRWARRRPGMAALGVLLAAAAVATGGASIALLRSRHELAVRAAEQTLINASYELSVDDREPAIEKFGQVIATEPARAEARLGRVLAFLSGPADPERAALVRSDLEAVAALHRCAAGVTALAERASAWGGMNAKPTLSDDVRNASPSDPLDFMVAGRIAFERSDFVAAERHFAEALRRGPQLPWAMLNRGIALKKLGRFDEARIEYEMLTRLWPEHYLSYNNLGNVLLELGRCDEADAAYRRAAELRPKDARLLANWGTGLNRCGRYPEAERILRRALDIDPSATAALNVLGSVLAGKGNHDEALALFDRVIEVELRNGANADQEELYNALNNRCDERLVMGDLHTAATVCREAVRAFPGRSTPHYNLAAYLARTGHESEALGELELDADLGDSQYDSAQAEPAFERLQRHPRFKALLGKMQRASKKAS